MNIGLPSDWKEVEEPDFEEFLKTCDDYTTDNWSDGRCYAWRHNDRRFAMIRNGKVFVDPSILLP